MKFWEIKNLSSSEGELILYGEICNSKPWWSEGNIIAPDSFLNDIAPLRNKSKVTIRLNSRGGDVFAAQAIYTQLKTMSATKTVIIDGIAASAATIIAMAGDIVKIPKGAAFMIHNPSITVWDSFEAKDLEQLTAMLNSVKDCIIETYMGKTSLSKQEISDMMDQEAWLTGSQAVEKGFCDEILETGDPIRNILNGRTLIINNVAHDLSGFKNMPKFEPVALNDHDGNQGKGTKKMTLDELKAEHGELVAQIENVARQDGATEERKRIKAIEEISGSLSKELVQKAKFEEPINAQELAFLAVQAASKQGENFLQQLTMDADRSGVGQVEAETGQLDDGEKTKAKAMAIADSMNKDKRRVK